VCAAVLSLAVPVAAGADEAAIPGHAVLARATGQALIIWDATPLFADVVRRKLPDSEANALIAHDALRILARMQPDLDKDAKSVTVRIVYAKKGEVSPVYGTATFEGIERYATLNANAADLSTDKDKWKEFDPNAPLPSWLSFAIVGKLPPR